MSISILIGGAIYIIIGSSGTTDLPSTNWTRTRNKTNTKYETCQLGKAFNMTFSWFVKSTWINTYHIDLLAL